MRLNNENKNDGGQMAIHPEWVKRVAQPNLASFTSLAGNPTCHHICMPVRKKLTQYEPSICEHRKFVTISCEQKNL
jgi:hypothetical protein